MAFCRSLSCGLFIRFHLKLPLVMLLVWFNTAGCYATGNGMVRTIKVGALVDFNSAMGKVVKRAIEVAVRDVNQYQMNVVNGWKIDLQMLDTNCSDIHAAAAAIELLKREVVAIVGPQSSSASYLVATVAGSMQVPLVSFGATNPALSGKQYPFFLRVVHSDAVQMAAVAAVIDYYRLREVIALHSADDRGTNGIAALGDALEELGSRITRKVSFASDLNKKSIGSILSQLETTKKQVFVIHMQQDVATTVFSEALSIGLMTRDFLWIVTEPIASSLHRVLQNPGGVKSMQRVVGIRTYIPDSPKFQNFISEQEEDEEQGTMDSSSRNIYGLYAYDSVCLIADSIDRYILKGTDIEFVNQSLFPSYDGDDSELPRLKLFKGGSLLRKEFSHARFNGMTGPVCLDNNGDRLDSTFEIVSIVGKDRLVVGYWTKYSGISRSPPEGDKISKDISVTNEPSLSNASSAEILAIVRPSGVTRIPRRAYLQRSGKILLVGIPRKAGYTELVSETIDSNNVTTFNGFCINVFEAALKHLPYSVRYKYVPYGNGSSTPVYESLIDQLEKKVSLYVCFPIIAFSLANNRTDTYASYLSA